MLHFKTDAALPARDAADIERLLATLREAHMAVEDIEIRRPDLEDVFITLMHKGEDAPQTQAQEAVV
jgi:ABC-2 type transport system ATP-binding protein